MAEQKSSSVLAAPLHGAASVLRRVPGAEAVGRAAQGTLDKVGAVSPRSRRLVVYTGAGVLGVAGLVEWPVALTGAAVAWLTQPRPGHTGDGGEQAPAQISATTRSATTKEARAAIEVPTGTAKKSSAPRTTRSASTKEARAAIEVPTGSGARTSRPMKESKEKSRTPTGRSKPAKSKAATAPLGPTARPDRTTL
ncbi:hypothetical protein [Streptomyces sp. NPDC046197]|uniref:hypothetical protein n=1 Tax=Streptomyces sp. NPDC046197 TaxID=3154337 RepID=UPI0034103A87